jgi:hypothetical protein
MAKKLLCQIRTVNKKWVGTVVVTDTKYLLFTIGTSFHCAIAEIVTKDIRIDDSRTLNPSLPWRRDFCIRTRAAP